LTALTLIEIDRAVTRFIPAAFAGTALEVIGALRSGGRYNPPNSPALYTSIKRSTALAEATQTVEDEDPITPMLMLSVLVRSKKIADLTNAATIRACGTTIAELTAPIIDKTIGTAPPQILGQVARSTGDIDGLLVWSRVVKREKNLVLFPDRLGMNYGLNDPDHDLPAIHPAVRAAVDILMGIGDA
jgi:RES domain-containing protein